MFPRLRLVKSKKVRKVCATLLLFFRQGSEQEQAVFPERNKKGATYKDWPKVNNVILRNYVHLWSFNFGEREGPSLFFNIFTYTPWNFDSHFIINFFSWLSKPRWGCKSRHINTYRQKPKRASRKKENILKIALLTATEDCDRLISDTRNLSAYIFMLFPALFPPRKIFTLFLSNFLETSKEPRYFTCNFDIRPRQVSSIALDYLKLWNIILPFVFSARETLKFNEWTDQLFLRTKTTYIR